MKKMSKLILNPILLIFRKIKIKSKQPQMIKIDQKVALLNLKMIKHKISNHKRIFPLKV